MTADENAEEPDPLQNDDGTRKPDLRYTGQERGNVRVERQLDGSGHLARGDRTHMSVLNFSARAAPRTDRDPEFAFRPAPAGAPKPPAAEASTPPTGAGSPPDPAPVAPDAAPPDAPDEGSVLGKIKKILGF